MPLESRPAYSDEAAATERGRSSFEMPIQSMRLDILFDSARGVRKRMLPAAGDPPADIARCDSNRRHADFGGLRRVDPVSTHEVRLAPKILIR